MIANREKQQIHISKSAPMCFFRNNKLKKSRDSKFGAFRRDGRANGEFYYFFGSLPLARAR